MLHHLSLLPPLLLLATFSNRFIGILASAASPQKSKGPTKSVCHIRGLGACMLAGYPHRQEDSFFHLALEQLREASSCQIISSSYPMGGFPITRVPKHLASRCLAANPNIVLIQFATSDLIVPLRRKRNRPKPGTQLPTERVSSQPPKPINRLIWQVQGLVGDVLQLKPVTSPAAYLETMLQIVQTLLDHQIIPVVMSPFVFGGRRSNRFAHECNVSLQQSLAKLPQAVYVDAHAALAQHPRHRILVSDGTHLSLLGHRIVASALTTHLKSLVDRLYGESLDKTAVMPNHDDSISQNPLVEKDALRQLPPVALARSKGSLMMALGCSFDATDWIMKLTKNAVLAV